jgi:hypothetical protein
MHAERKITVCSHNTLLLHIPLLALTHPQTELRRNKLILVGLGNLRFLQINRENVPLPFCHIAVLFHR